MSRFDSDLQDHGLRSSKAESLTLNQSVPVRLRVGPPFMKKCCTCKAEKPLGAFNKNKAKRDGLGTKCRECANKHSREHYRKDKKAHLARVRKNKQETKLANQALFWTYLCSKQCADCGNNDPQVLEADHVRGSKVDHVSKLLGGCSSWKTILRELEKCDIVCANCHRKRTFSRSKSWRYRAASIKSDALGF